MPKLNKGDKAPEISLPAINGSTFEMSSMKGRRVILTFFRFSSCPFCNIRIDRIIKRWEEFPDDTVIVGIFDAQIDELSRRMSKRGAPFTIVADETYRHFNENGVEKSYARFMWGAIRSPITMILATLKGYIPVSYTHLTLPTICSV